MASPIKEIKLNIAVSLYISPCTEDVLCKRDFLKNYWVGDVQRLIMQLEKDAIYYKGNTMHISKSWAKKNLKEYDLDFRTEREKVIDSMSDFKRSVFGL